MKRGITLKRAPVRIVAATVPTLFLFAVAAATPVYADANPNNEGHHYGQLKHPKTHPTPSPVPVPTPAPVQAPAPVAGPTPAPTHGGGGINNPIATTTLPATSHAPESRGTAPVAPAPRDAFWWLILLVLPLLAAVWLVALRGIVAGALRGAAAQPAVPGKVASVPTPQPAS